MRVAWLLEDPAQSFIRSFPTVVNETPLESERGSDPRRRNVVLRTRIDMKLSCKEGGSGTPCPGERLP